MVRRIVGVRMKALTPTCALPDDEKLVGVVKIESEEDDAAANGTGGSDFSADDAAGPNGTAD